MYDTFFFNFSYSAWMIKASELSKFMPASFKSVVTKQIIVQKCWSNLILYIANTFGEVDAKIE